MTEADHLRLAREVASGAERGLANAEHCADAGLGVLAGLWANVVAACHLTVEAHEMAITLLLRQPTANPLRALHFLGTAADLRRQTATFVHRAREASEREGVKTWG